MKVREKRSGFSLIEVLLALTVLATGILTIATLFPLGLEMGRDGQADMQQTVFAEYALNTIVAQANDLTGVSSLNDWNTRVQNSLSSIVTPNNIFTKYALVPTRLGFAITVQVAYRSNGSQLSVADQTSILNNSPVYYTEVIYQGIQ